MTARPTWLGRLARRRRSERGFALLVALWAVGLVALAAATFTRAVRVDVRSVRDTADIASATLLADAGVNLALIDLLASAANDTTRRYRLDGTPAACRGPGGSMVLISVADEAGKIDLNAARDPLLRALLTGTGAGESDADAMLAAIADFKDADDERRAGGAEADDYRAAQRPGPKNAPFESIDELAQVLGMRGEVVARVRPYLTVHSGQSGVDPRVAPAPLVDLLSRAGPGTLGAGGFARSAGSSGFPPQFATASARQAFSIRAEALTVTGVRFVREAVASLEMRRPSAPVASLDAEDTTDPLSRPSRPRRTGASGSAERLMFRMLHWRQGTADGPVPSPAEIRERAEAAPPC